MPPEPRFRRVAALGRPFVNREAALELVEAELRRVGDGPRVLNVTGVGGIGKSRLLREIRNRAAGYRIAELDLQVPAQRSQAEALAVLRRQFGEQGVRFDRYDIAYAVLWSRMHPHLQINREGMPFAQESEILSSVLDAAVGVPLAGSAVQMLRLVEKARTGAHNRKLLAQDETLRQLDGLPVSALTDAVTYLFASDLREGSTDRPYAVFIDAHEAMRGADDAWLRDLVGQLDRGLTVLASREAVQWDAEWESCLREVQLRGLPMEARLQLLADGGVQDGRERASIAKASAGVPFYLHLVVDTHQDGRSGAVSGEQILARFLEHVDRSEIRYLELLSATRIFDFEVFQGLCSAFQLPAHRLAWEPLISYSFVYPAGAGFLQLHQLMGAALRARLTSEAAREVHRVLRKIWDERDVPREAAFHAHAAGDLTEDDLLAYADRISRSGAARDVGSLLDDLKDSDVLGEAIRCLRAEQAVLVGDAALAVELTHENGWELSSQAGSRLAVAAAHGQRIAGNTAAALAIYGSVLERGVPSCCPDAGLWAADLHMAQGRFVQARALATELLATTEDAERRGDLARLLCLAERFAYDYPTSARWLAEAELSYTGAGSSLGLAALKVNRAELLAWTDPAAAVACAGEAIEAQRELGALHELGKAYTALALARLRLGELRAADHALDLADAVLDQCNYRSGRARAELTRAFVAARRGLPVQAAAHARWAVAELVAAEVYPTLILLAERLLHVLDLADPAVTRHATAARAALGEDFTTRTATAVTTLLGFDPCALYEEAVAHPSPAAGFYNRNVRVGSLLVRIPIADADGMDLRLWPEHEILAAVSAHDISAPKLLFASARPFQIHTHVDGVLLDETAPKGTAVPSHVLGDVTELFRLLADVSPRELPPTPDWVPDGDTRAFADRLSAVTARVHADFRDDFAPLFRALGIPPEPLAALDWATLTSRPFRLVHSDVHRKNMILSGSRTVFLDWELALWGDPVYDLAVHLHKMAYLPSEQERLIRLWSTAMPGHLITGWRHDLSLYLRHERIKSAIVDTVRYTQLFRDGVPPARAQALLTNLTTKLNAPAWFPPLTPRTVHTHLTAYLSTH
ncbi:phosphotransferase [Actinocorallia sp. B10E7]|uniref:phosphotransferase n=1 Tax=Actinocorallia sp. B10E7 TaxID=3153558 RepID=UPI00325EB342